MAIPMGRSLDFGGKSEIQNALIQRLGTDPSSLSVADEGRIWQATTQHELSYWNGTRVVRLTDGYVTGVTVTGPLVNSGTAQAPNLTVQAATAAQDGYLSAAHYALLAGATASATPNTLVERDGSGNFVANVISAALTATGTVNMQSNPLTGLDAPVNPTDAATKAYVDSSAAGWDVKASVRLATASPLPANSYAGGVLTGTANGALTVDGIAVATGDRILVKDEGTAANNGIYTVTNAGGAGAAYVLTRSADLNANSGDAPGAINAGAFTFAEQGSNNTATAWVLVTQGPITVGTTDLEFSQVGSSATYQAGNGLTLTGNSFSAVGTANRIVVGSSIDISAAYVGQTSITTLGTINTGTWQGAPVGLAYGGTGATTAAGARANLGISGGQTYSTTFGDGATTSYVIAHNLGTQDVRVTVYGTSAPYAEEWVEVQHTSATSVTLVFDAPPAINSLRVVVSN